LSHAKAWRKAANLREFIRAVETAIGEQLRSEQFGLDLVGRSAKPISLIQSAQGFFSF
jgi:hypothetical protein